MYVPDTTECSGSLDCKMMVGFCYYWSVYTMQTDCYSNSESEKWLADNNIAVYFYYQQQYANFNDITGLVSDGPNNYLYQDFLILQTGMAYTNSYFVQKTQTIL